MKNKIMAVPNDVFKFSISLSSDLELEEIVFVNPTNKVPWGLKELDMTEW